MLGLYRTHGPHHWFLWWVACMLGLASCLVSVLTLGCISTDWSIRWFVYLNRRRHGESARMIIFNWLQEGRHQRLKEKHARNQKS